VSRLFRERTYSLGSTQADGGALIDNLLGAGVLPDAIHRKILDKTGGNPFFIEEVVRVLIADATLAKDARTGAWRLAKPVIERLAELAVEGRTLQRGELSRRNFHVCALGAAIMLERLGVGRHAARLIAGLEEIVLRLLPLLRECAVVGEQARELLETIGKQRLDRLGHAPVDGAAPLGQDAAIGRLLHQGVLEDVLNVRQLLAQADEVGLHKPVEAAFDGIAGICDGLEDAQQERSADHRCELERTLDTFLKAVDARNDDILDGVRKSEIDDSSAKGVRGELVAERTAAAKALAGIQVEKAKVAGDRRIVEADLGPVRYLAALLGASDEDVMRWFILVVALLLDPAAVLLLLAASRKN
jgi:hypothetical protein